MNGRDLVRASAIRAGYDRRFDDLIRILGWKRSTFYKRLADPDTATVAELREFCQATGMSAAEVAELIGERNGRENHGAKTLRRG